MNMIAYLLNLYFLYIFIFQKTHFIFKLIFRATELQLRHKYNISESAILDFSLNYKFGTKYCSNCSWKYL